MHYKNQPFHKDLDRFAIRDILLALASSRAQKPEAEEDKKADDDGGQKKPADTFGKKPPADGPLQKLKSQCDSELERQWLDYLCEHKLRLPDKAQPLIACCGTRPDFWYEEQKAAVYIDGPVHEYEDNRKRDAEQQACLEDMGLQVVRFAQGEQYMAIIREHPDIFGTEKD